MKRRNGVRVLFGFQLLIGGAVGCADAGSEGGEAALLQGALRGGRGGTCGLSGAVFTTFDATQGGCVNNSAINCNHYENKPDVYLSGGPRRVALADGRYTFAVLVPGSQNGGFLDGASGNLSDRFAGGTAGDLGSGDDDANRTFRVSRGAITYGGTHVVGESPQGLPILRLFPFDDTSSPGGVYILAVCKVGAAGPCDCKFDAFKIACEAECPAADAGAAPDLSPPPADLSPPPAPADLSPPADLRPPPAAPDLSCPVPVCSAGSGSCDGVCDNGCETDLANDPTNCGACGNVCGGYGAICFEGQCYLAPF